MQQRSFRIPFRRFGIAEGMFQLIQIAAEADGGGLDAGEGVAPVFGAEGGEALVEMVDGFGEIGYGGADGGVVQQGRVAGGSGGRTAAGQDGGGE